MTLLSFLLLMTDQHQRKLFHSNARLAGADDFGVK
jgi:hypothetical protein